MTSANPDPKRDYFSCLSDCFGEPTIDISLRYVPDKLLLDPGAFSRYLTHLSEDVPKSFEELALMVLEDVNNEIVPRWVQIEVARRGSDEQQHQVIVVDQQPRWQNPNLLNRLP